MRYVIAIILLGMLAGCAGKIYTIIEPQLEPKMRIDGVIVYQPKPLVLVIETTHAQDKDGNIIGSGDNGTCKPVRSFEITSVPDYTKPYVVGYDPAPFESKKFSLELEKGVITKINNESTSAAKEVLDVFQGILGTFKEISTKAAVVLTKEAVPVCNVGKKIIGRIDITDIQTIKP
jgi:hypothetical protein